MTPVLVFDLETIPDVAGLRRLHPELADRADAEVAQWAMDRRREKTGSDFLPLHLHRVVAIGCLFRDADGVRVKCLGAPDDPEARQIQDFYRIVDRYTPQIVTWNGSGFDMQVLHYRGLVHGVSAPRYWELGDDDRDFKWNNYISRYHTRHLDLMDLLALYSGRGAATSWRACAGFPASSGWTARRSGRPGRRAASMRSARTARPTSPTPG